MTRDPAAPDGAGSPSGETGAVAVRLHRVGPEDWRSHRELRLAMIDADPEAFWVPPDIRTAWDEARWRADAAGPRLHLQARRGEAVLGGIGVLPQGYDEDDAIGPEEPHLVSLWVRPKVRGQGLSQLLLNAAAQLAIDISRPHLTLHVDSRNSAAQRLYERLGFTRASLVHPRAETGSSWLQYEIEAPALLTA